MSARYLHTYNLYYFHNNTSDSYDETQGQVQRWVTFTYFQGHCLIKENVCLHDISAPTIFSHFHINTSDPYDKTQVHLFVRITDDDKSWFIQFVSL